MFAEPASGSRRVSPIRMSRKCHVWPKLELALQATGGDEALERGVSGQKKLVKRIGKI